MANGIRNNVDLFNEFLVEYVNRLELRKWKCQYCMLYIRLVQSINSICISCNCLLYRLNDYRNGIIVKTYLLPRIISSKFDCFTCFFFKSMQILIPFHFPRFSRKLLFDFDIYFIALKCHIISFSMYLYLYHCTQLFLPFDLLNFRYSNNNNKNRKKKLIILLRKMIDRKCEW